MSSLGKHAYIQHRLWPLRRAAACAAPLDIRPAPRYAFGMPPSAHTPSLRELMLASDLGRANPARVDELLDRCADPLTESRGRARHSDNCVAPHYTERSDAA